MELELEMTIIDIEIGHKTRKKSSPLIRMKHIQNRSSMNMIRMTFCKTRHFFFANSFITRLLWKEEQFFAENILYSGAIYFVFGNGRLIKSVNCRGMEWHRIYFLLRDCELFNTKRWGWQRFAPNPLRFIRFRPESIPRQPVPNEFPISSCESEDALLFYFLLICLRPLRRLDGWPAGGLSSPSV